MPRRLRTLRIVDDTARLWRAPEARFDAHEIGLDAFACNIENRHLVAALEARAPAMPNLHADRGRRGRGRQPTIDGVVIRTVDGDTVARQACGRRRRHALALPRRPPASTMRSRSYPQIALTFNVTPQPPASRHLDRIPHRARPVHARAAAGPALEPRLRGRSGRRANDLQSLDADQRSIANWSAARIRSSARSRSSPAAAHFRWRSKPRSAFAARADRADRRSRASLPADRRAGPQSRPARCRDDRRTRVSTHRDDPGIATGRARRATIASAAPTSPAAPSRSIC